MQIAGRVQTKISRNSRNTNKSQRSNILLMSKCLFSPLPELGRILFIQVSGLIQNTDLNQLWPSFPVLLADLCLRLQRPWKGRLGLQVAAIPGPLPYQIMSLPQMPVISKLEFWVFQRFGCYSILWKECPLSRNSPLENIVQVLYN